MTQWGTATHRGKGQRCWESGLWIPEGQQRSATDVCYGTSKSEPHECVHQCICFNVWFNSRELSFIGSLSHKRGASMLTNEEKAVDAKEMQPLIPEGQQFIYLPLFFLLLRMWTHLASPYLSANKMKCTQCSSRARCNHRNCLCQRFVSHVRWALRRDTNEINPKVWQ